ncbi:MAG: hypothetical protein QGH37_16760 [Candidatus Poribacteria bacterium]|nr:hypothetical protein [Candidatus Poribacteria bacterium]
MEVKTEDLGIFKKSIRLDALGGWEITAIWDGNDDYDSTTKTLSINVSAELEKPSLFQVVEIQKSTLMVRE